MLIEQNGTLHTVATDALATHAYIQSLFAHPEANAISVKTYLLAHTHADAADRVLLDDWLKQRLQQVAQSVQQPATTPNARHAQHILTRWLASYAQNEAIASDLRQAASVRIKLASN